MIHPTSRTLFTLAWVGLLATSAPAEAEAHRTWVSVAGTDDNPCTRNAPCKTFAGAHAKTAAGGQINVLDPGGYGSVTITKSLTITSAIENGGILAIGESGIVVQAAPTDVVVLHGLDIIGPDPTIVVPPPHGIEVRSAAAVFVENCILNRFAQHGIHFAPSGASSLFVTDTLIRNNDAEPSGGGIWVQGSAAAEVSVFLDNVRLERNLTGLHAEGFARVQVRNSAAVGNVFGGFEAYAAGGTVEMNVDGSRASGGSQGVRAAGATATVRLSDTTVTSNQRGLWATGGAKLLSFGNNRVAGNQIDGSPTATLVQK